MLSQIIIGVNQISIYSRANLIEETLREHRINMLFFIFFFFGPNISNKYFYSRSENWKRNCW